MMNNRDRLVKLLGELRYLGGLERIIADHLIANGVTVPVRCRECLYFENGKDYVPYCNNWDGLREIKEDDYCSYGKRKEK